MASDKLIVALDVESGDRAVELARALKAELSLFKIGSVLFTKEGPDLVRRLRDEGVDVFLDLKFHDIPQTVAKAVKAAADLGVCMLTLHTSGGYAMLEAAHKAAGENGPQLLGVTVLTSLDDDALRDIGIDHTVPGQVLNLARLASDAGLTGLVCSPLEVELIRDELPDRQFKLVTPGIRGKADAAGDQKRTLSAGEALRLGSSHLVVGRPIYEAADPVAAARALLAECDEALAESS